LGTYGSERSGIREDSRLLTFALAEKNAKAHSFTKPSLAKVQERLECETVGERQAQFKQ
jgi:hypothetical protein